jgi:hypothetical protein
MTATSWIQKADAYLLWGIDTRFRYLQSTDIGPTGTGVGLLARRADSGHIDSLVVQAADLIGDPEAMLARFDRVELASPIALTREPMVGLNILNLKHKAVLGVIDDGFPFAQAQWADRLVRLWDQNGPRTLDERGDPVAPGYGRLWRGDELAALVQAQVGNGLPPDVAAYRAADMHSLQRRATHGAHVVDLLAGMRPPRARVSASRETLEEGQDGSATTAPQWRTPADAASEAPLLCVQLPRAAIEDPTGRWLGLHVLDGLDQIIEAVGTGNAKDQTIVVNLSWGPQTGPHDGSSLLELALEQRVAAQLAIERVLAIVLPAGNSFGARAHAQVDARQGGVVTWCVPPDCRAPSFLELWWPSGATVDARVVVQAPDGRTFSMADADTQVAVIDEGATAWLSRVSIAGRPMVLLALAPTAGESDRAPHGAWRVKVSKAASHSAGEPVHIYVARQSANMGARRRGPDSFLYDPKYEEERQNALFPAEVPDSVVRREGTLNGLATGESTIVVGGSVLNRSQLGGDRAMALYSSSGPGAGANGRNPSLATASDESPVLRGLRAGGVRPGSSVRLVGTSVAAPQIARKLACLAAGQNATQSPSSGKPPNPSRAGAGISTPMNGPAPIELQRLQQLNSKS